MKKVCHDRDEVSYGELHGIRWPLEVFNDFRRNRNVVFLIPRLRFQSGVKVSFCARGIEQWNIVFHVLTVCIEGGSRIAVTELTLSCATARTQK